jgi:pimeloyl-ACP methyl ester carboxylesterase
VQSVIIQGRKVCYRHQGAGEPVVLLHGFLSDSRSWMPQIESLAPDYRAIAWDAPGCGDSDDPPPSFGFPEYADCLAQLLDLLGVQSAHLVGLSWGGACALEFWRRHPQGVRSLVISGGYAGWKGSLPADTVQQRLERATREAALPPDAWVDAWIPGLLSESASADTRKEARAILSSFHPAGYMVMARALAESDLRPVLATITVPTLLIWGTNDQRSSVEVGRDLHARIPHSEFVEVPGAGHLLNVDAPDTFTETVSNFLRQQQA